jgi:hypothetical protein
MLAIKSHLWSAAGQRWWAEEQSAQCDIVVGYESPELAALAVAEDTEREAVFAREEMSLPNFGGEQQVLDGVGASGYIDTYSTRQQLSKYLVESKLLAVWTPSFWSPYEHMVAINSQHPAFKTITVKASVFSLSPKVLATPLW